MAASNASALAIQFESCILVNGAFAVSPNVAFQCLVLVLLLCGEKIRVQNELMIKSGIEVKNDKMVLQNPFTDTLGFCVLWVFFGFFFAKCSCCDLLPQIRKMILPSFCDMAVVNCS